MRKKRKSQNEKKNFLLTLLPNSAIKKLQKKCAAAQEL